MRFYIWEHHGYDPSFKPYRRQKLQLPRMYCDECGRLFQGAPSASNIPEPIPDSVKGLLAPYQKDVPEDLHRRYWEAFGRSDWNNPVVHEYERFNSASVEEFRTLSHQIRRLYGLASHRPVMPGAYLGPHFVRKSFSPRWGAYGPDAATGSLYFSSEVADALTKRGVSGIELFPVQTSTGKQSSVYLAVVTGEGGVPNVDGGELAVCNQCGGWKVLGRTKVHYRVDEQQWDGSDFFRFRYACLVVSERVVEVLRRFGESRLPHTRLEPLAERLWATDDLPVDFGPYNFLEIFRGSGGQEQG